LYATVKSIKHRVLYDIDEGGDEPIIFRYGPVSELLSMTVQGTTVTLDSNGESEDIELGYWTVKYFPGFTANDVVDFSIIVGFSPQPCPADLREAIVQTSQLIRQYPNVAIISERIGDYAVTYADPADIDKFAGLNARVVNLLVDFVNPFIG